MMPRARLTAVVLIAVWLFSPHASAQTDWMKKGQEMLGGFGQKESGSTRGGSPSGSTGGLSAGDIGAGLKEALKVGTENVVGKLGKTDGFNADPAIRIPLPDSMQYAKTTLERLGMGAMLTDLETRLNRAAEVATPKAKDLFIDAIAKMTMDDVKKIYNGPADAATRYFQGKMSAPLADAMRPVIDQSLSEVGAVRSYDQAISQYKAIPFVPDVKADLTDHVVGKGIDGIFHYLAKEEAAIRQNPMSRTTDLLKKVFGN
ncbi:MAG: DUF4197 domain-containing protein [Rhodospirillales bacterium]